jgi:hypothetical protein
VLVPQHPEPVTKIRIIKIKEARVFGVAQATIVLSARLKQRALQQLLGSLWHAHAIDMALMPSAAQARCIAMEIHALTYQVCRRAKQL